MKLTKEQKLALYRVWSRSHCLYRPSYLSFRRQAFLGPGCIMIPWRGMFLGIEPDGYTHS